MQPASGPAQPSKLMSGRQMASPPLQMEGRGLETDDGPEEEARPEQGQARL